LRSDHAVPTALPGPVRGGEAAHRIDVEAIDIVKRGTDLPAAVARLAPLVPPADARRPGR
jgi:hypothetical protein